MINAAEKMGATVVFLQPKERAFDAGSALNLMGLNKGVAWNVPGYTNMPKAVDDSYSDFDYINRVRADLDTQANLAQKAGFVGFSDGARMLQLYAANNPDKVSGVYSSHGTWMFGDRMPAASVPMKIVLGAQDETLPMRGGLGKVSNTMDGFVSTNLGVHSNPLDQIKVWKPANKCSDDGRTTITPDATIVDFNCKGAPLVVNVFNKSQHSFDDYLNFGPRNVQSMLGGTPLDNQRGAIDAARFVLGRRTYERRIAN